LLTNSVRAGGAMMDWLLAVSLVFTTASQLRLANVPVGPGELGLVAWIAVNGINTLVTRAPFLTRTGLALLIFWAAFALALSLGAITAMFTGEEFDTDLMLHDVVSYALMAMVSIGLCATEPACMRRISWIMVCCGAVSLSLQLANGIGLMHISGIDPWYWDRLRGWSSNPNQLAFVCLVVALLAWYLADTAAGFGSRLAALVVLIPAIAVGRMSKSDTFTFALVASLPVWIAAKLIIWVRNDRLEPSLRGSIARLSLVALPVLLLCFTPLVLSRAEAVRGLVLGLAKNAGAEAVDEVNLRVKLWDQAIQRGIESGMLGLGPGPHLHIPASIVAGRVSEGMEAPKLEHPVQNGTANYEAHNTLLDVFTQGGLLAAASVALLLLRAMYCAYRARSAGLASLIAGVTVFMMTGNIIRQPIFWFALVLCLSAPVARLEPRRPTPSAW
jgi:hypothetical protein